jgi:hypothetical protein
MSGSLEVSFNSPQCGWMSVGFEGGGQEFHTTTAHAPHEIALPELLRILTALLDPSSPQNEYLLQWNRDPEAYDFRFARSAGYVMLEIYEYPTDEREPSLRELVFSYSGELHEFCQAFAATFEQLYADRDTDEFEFNWRQPFPLKEFEKFRESLENG